MNKLTKGSLAAGAGLVLLLGGAGTFMSWQDQEALGGGDVTAGYLGLTAAGAPIWTVNGTEVTDISGFRIVPGDTVLYTAPLEVTAQGDNLEATLALGGGAITPTNGTDADNALVTALEETTNLDLTSAKEGFAVREQGNVYRITAGPDRVTEDATVTVELKFPSGLDGDEAAMDGSVSLADMSVTLTQETESAV